jgi:hypothetical protein
MEEAVDEERTRFIIHLVFDRDTPERDLDHRMEIGGGLLPVEISRNSMSTSLERYRGYAAPTAGDSVWQADLSLTNTVATAA